MAKWILSAESYGAFRHTKEYIPVPNPHGVTIITERQAIRLTSGCRWATRGHYVYARDTSQLDSIHCERLSDTQSS